MSISDRAFVLHSLPYKETSLIVELLTREHGRLPVIAKGAKRPHSALRPVLVGFQPLHVRFSGKSEVKTLMQAEWAGALMPPDGPALFAAYYFNELLMNGILRDDPHPELFDCYERLLNELTQQSQLSVSVRQFELAVLTDLGYGIDFTADHEGQALQDDEFYDFEPDSGWVSVLSKEMPHNNASSHLANCLGLKISGRSIALLGAGAMNEELAKLAKPLTRQLLSRYLTPKGVSSRTWMEQLIRHD